MTGAVPSPFSAGASSPLATGAAGPVFEQHVDAVFLSVLLVRGIPPILTDCLLTEVHLQTGHKGWRTDDVLLVGVRGDDERVQLALQIKRAFTVSKNDQDCCKAFHDFWRDFNNPAVFRPDRDKLGLVVQQGTKVLLHGLGTLLDCARASFDAVDFGHRLKTSGFLSRKSVEFADHIRMIVQQVPDVVFGEDRFWRFLGAVHLLSYDAATSTSQTEASIQTMLAHTAAGPDKRAAASQTWAELLDFAGRMMPQAGSIARKDLPATARDRHTPIADSTFTALNRLLAHSHTVLRSIRTALAGGLELPREEPVADLLEQLATVRAVIVTGPAGCGKSVLAKRCVNRLASNSVVLVFRAEEFATTHLDDTLHQAQVAIGSEELFGLLAGQDRKIVQVESVERLLESSQREAFLDLLRLMASDSSWSLVLTCRDYSVETVKAAFLDQAGLPCAIYVIPELTDQELAQAVAAIPALNLPTSDAFLNKLFRNPYYLDKAAAMSWAPGATLPATERAFRDKFWREVVRQDDQTKDGMPRRREQALVQLCLLRAKALAPYAQCSSLDREALHRLRSDNLITYSDRSELLAAPAHDALEDWAVVRWIEETWVVNRDSRVSFAGQLGPYPAVRRAYRKWLNELLDASPTEAAAYVVGTIQEVSIPAHFRDDTLVSALLSPTVAAILTQIRDDLLANDDLLLRRVIHLMRVACKTTPPWIRPLGQARSIWLVPYGPAWPAVLRLVREELGNLARADVGLVVGAVVDWAQGIAWWAPYPAGIDDAAAICHQLLPRFGGYGRSDVRRQLLDVIVKIPKGDEAAFADLARRASLLNHEDRTAEEFAELLLLGLSGAFACADVPEVVIALANAYYRERPRKRSDYSDHSLDLEPVFGLHEHLSMHMPEPSALRGPFLSLLQRHANKGVPFIVGLLNYACDNFAARHGMLRLDGPWEVVLTFSDGTTRGQWCEYRLWPAYRGMSVTPHVLQCALMALESWLLELAGRSPQHLEGWLLHILRESNNVALTGVVASVATAFPAEAREACLVLLACRDIVLLDKTRLVGESHPPSAVAAMIPPRSGEAQVYHMERVQSDKRPHRKLDLEYVAVALAQGPLRDRVYAILDAHRLTLPPEDKQSEGDKIWRLALHRMDFRRYAVVAEGSADGPAATATGTDEPGARATGRRSVTMMPVGLETDLHAYVQEGEPERQMFAERTAVFMWAVACFQRNEKAKPEAWRERLATAQGLTRGDRSQIDNDRIARNTPGYVAAVCIRDHWDELTNTERDWCVDELALAVRRDAENDDPLTRSSRNDLDSSRPAAYLLPLVLTHDLGKHEHEQVRQAIATAISHPSEEVVTYAAEGVACYLSDKAPDFVSACVRALVTKAFLLERLLREQRQLPYEQRLRPDQMERKVRPRVRTTVLAGTTCTTAALLTLDLEDGWHREAMGQILTLLQRMPSAPLTTAALGLVARVVVEWWTADRRRTNERRDRNHRAELEYLRKLAEFCVRLTPSDAIRMLSPIFDAVEECPDDVEDFVIALIIAADQHDGVGAFWEIWQGFAQRVLAASWLDKLQEHDRGDNLLLSAMFLGAPWKEGVRHWRHLAGSAHRLDEFFKALPAVRLVFRYYLRFLDEIGERSMPAAFIVLSRRVREAKAQDMLWDHVSSFSLENLLRRHVYGRPAELKARSDLRDAVLHLLDELVNAGSSVAYRMRDDFVTPGSLSVQTPSRTGPNCS